MSLGPHFCKHLQCDFDHHTFDSSLFSERLEYGMHHVYDHYDHNRDISSHKQQETDSGIVQ
ncbi:hypothetical protein Pmar_PMAR005491 [Perkinsus marinus ATCC 50983]|uniref:Uncharacterized protein n=1 Tax=Perkinsus marinus (strain ATCC 50983 / TXsc) TaxID=423536 RepID=C5L1W1_PERM5|nr:hypothetical protein Pmar_PMAR005491 [Perkinsus marinus ATCC 50983]EER09282.1 hypothetical protein Pmar_PMAR005491 [Perkinsus marinus ATCC 50983]|eukprot:XP_002777466.1 hypothetical protein Pmar_PMAR005491 [Perkinsus marinus ATCC 50983]